MCFCVNWQLRVLYTTPYITGEPQTQRELEIFKAAADIKNRFGDKAITQSIISNAEQVKWFVGIGIVIERIRAIIGPKMAYPWAVSTSYLCLKPLKRCKTVPASSELLDKPWYKSVLIVVTICKEIMLGYSDSNKDGGYVTSQWSLYQAEIQLVEMAKNMPFNCVYSTVVAVAWVVVVVRHFEAILAQPEGSVDGQIHYYRAREVITAKYADAGNAERNLETLIAATLKTSLLPNHSESPDSDLMNQLSHEAFNCYRALITQPYFIDYFLQTSLVKEIASLNIGSRPASRKSLAYSKICARFLRYFLGCKIAWCCQRGMVLAPQSKTDCR